jgi:formylglycine-generating enzyme required for sulfatase activity
MVSAANAVRAVIVVAAVCVFQSWAASAPVNIEMVPVGNTGNTADIRYAEPGYGAVESRYNIGMYEVTAGQYTVFLNAVAAEDAYGLYNPDMWSSDYGCKIEQAGTGTGYSYRVAADWADRPVNYVSWGDAARFVNWLHNGQPAGAQSLTTTEDGAYYLNGATSYSQLVDVTRKADWTWALPSENEWYKAAYYNPVTATYSEYPTGSNSLPGRDMTETTNKGNNVNYRETPYPIDPPYYTTVVGEFELSDGAYHTFDQGGNVQEWSDTVTGSQDWRVLRGGSFGFSADGSLQAKGGASATPTYASEFIGFRVVGRGYLEQYTDRLIAVHDEYYDLRMHETAVARMTGGTVSHNFIAEDDSTVLLDDGYVEYLTSRKESDITVNGGTVHWLRAYDNGTAVLKGGELHYAYTFSEGDLYLHGGSIRSYLYASGTGSVHVYGTDLVLSHSGGSYDDGYIEGKWADGSSFSVSLCDYDFNSRYSDTSSRVVLHEVPEPASIVLLLAGISLLARRRAA